MGKVAVFLNGIPGAGKTTLAGPLGRELGITVLRRDAIKEGLADLVPLRLPTSPLGAIASRAMWDMLRIIEAPTLVESFWATGRDEAYFEAGLLTAGIEHGVEVWCVVPNEVAHQRVLTRTRHRAHHDRERASEWDGITGGAKPISRFPIVEVDTSREVDVPGLANAVRALLPELPRN